LSVEVMKQKAQKIEEERREFEKECNLMYGRSLPEQEQHLQQIEMERVDQLEQLRLEKQDRDREQALAFEKRTQIQSTLTEYFGHVHPQQAKIMDPLREEGLLESWRLLPADKRGDILDRAKSDAGWHRDSWGKWEQNHPRMYQ
ncbi:MAG: hypothetical protein KAV87_19535, partial [Desulfobacteraceae bacterium]|nr:hypothetical protein [Desulfobacteraceae bacterium]